ncbi:class I SAM-dependent methyltransferase [Baaleninema simplex]|uniref:class I SAM-dependent methyltransferase n=1 Tax=Baaleninema simplex TaxID=2862350 RepID=UPI00034C4F0F|nr:class I SAM-dependent methyltransferase [Baaleninema simplex]
MTSSFFDGKRQFFDIWASNYDCLLTTVFYQAIHQRLLEFVELPPSPRLLDLGCGTGRLLDRFARTYPDLQGTGLDLSLEMIQQARKRNAFDDRLDFAVGNVESLPFDAEQFDAVSCTVSFLHYPRPEVAIAEIDRVLKPGGRFYFVDYLPFEGFGENSIYPVSPGGLRLYARSQREDFAKPVGWRCEGHYHLLIRIVLTIFVKSEN